MSNNILKTIWDTWENLDYTLLTKGKTLGANTFKELFTKLTGDMDKNEFIVSFKLLTSKEQYSDQENEIYGRLLDKINLCYTAYSHAEINNVQIEKSLTKFRSKLTASGQVEVKEYNTHGALALCLDTWDASRPDVLVDRFKQMILTGVYRDYSVVVPDKEFSCIIFEKFTDEYIKINSNTDLNIVLSETFKDDSASMFKQVACQMLLYLLANQLVSTDDIDIVFTKKSLIGDNVTLVPSIKFSEILNPFTSTTKEIAETIVYEVTNENGREVYAI